jgi:hypothetical protein
LRFASRRVSSYVVAPAHAPCQSKSEHIIRDDDMAGVDDRTLTNGSLPQQQAWADRHAIRLKQQEATNAELSKGQTKPVNEAMERGMTADKEVQLLNTLEVLSRQTPAALSGPFANLFVEAGKGLREVSGGTLGWDTASAEAVSKINSALASLAAREITNRPALAEFSNMITANPGLFNSSEGRLLLIDMLRQGATQDSALSKLAQKVKDPSDWADIRDNYFREHPLNITYKGASYQANKEGIGRLQYDLAPPTAKHIEALRNNLSKREEFEGKFGYGSAKRALRE